MGGPERKAHQTGLQAGTIHLFHIKVPQQQATPKSLPVQAEDPPALGQDELHDLVLVNHVDRHVAGILLCPHEGGAEDNAEALGRHQVLGGERQNPEVEPHTRGGVKSVVGRSVHPGENK